MSDVGIGVVGLGFMGRTHAANAIELGSVEGVCRLAAVCSPGIHTIEDLGAKDVAGNIDTLDQWPEIATPRVARTYGDLLSGDDVDLVIICTPTPLHVGMAIEALEAGKHVLVEKPVALSEREIAPLIEASERRPDRHCMPAHVMRFWPGWTDLAQMILDRHYGGVRSAVFQRLGSTPTWGRGFYDDHARSGGALVDLHIHDVDFIIHCFGVPRDVHAFGDSSHVTASYTFEGAIPHVTAEASWNRHPDAGFLMRFAVEFENATVEFDSTAKRPLRISDGTAPASQSRAHGDGYASQLRAVVDAIRDNEPTPVGIECAVEAARVIDRERVLLEATRER